MLYEKIQTLRKNSYFTKIVFVLDKNFQAPDVQVRRNKGSLTKEVLIVAIHRRSFLFPHLLVAGL